MLFASLLPKVFIEWYQAEVKARVVRMFGLVDRQLDLLEAEIEDRRAFSGITAPELRIERPESKSHGRKSRV